MTVTGGTACTLTAMSLRCCSQPRDLLKTSEEARTELRTSVCAIHTCPGRLPDPLMTLPHSERAETLAEWPGPALLGGQRAAMALRAEYEADCVLRAATADQDGRAAASALSGPSAAAAWSAAPASDLPEQAPADIGNISAAVQAAMPPC